MFALVALIAAAPVVATDVAGRWDMQAGGTTLFRIEVVQTPIATSATWERSERMMSDDGGESFTSVRGPIVRRVARTINVLEDGVELTFDDPAPGEGPEVLLLRRVASDRLELSIQGVPFEPFQLVPTPLGAPPLGGFDAARRYQRVVSRPTNAEMTAIYEADQADRRAVPIDWAIVGPADDARRARAEELLDAGELRSGSDHLHAAFVFQHGDKPADYLKAHLLAMIAVAREEPGGLWIAAAALDRYLRSIGQSQVLGTQFSWPADGPVTQEPYDRGILTDAMRRALNVPTLAQQDEQRRAMDVRNSEAQLTE